MAAATLASASGVAGRRRRIDRDARGILGLDFGDLGDVALGTAMWTSPDGEQWQPASARRTLAAVFRPSSVIAALVNGR